MKNLAIGLWIIQVLAAFTMLIAAVFETESILATGPTLVVIGLLLGLANLPQWFKSRLESFLGISAVTAMAAIILMVNCSSFYIWLKPAIYFDQGRGTEVALIADSIPTGASLAAPKYMAGILIRNHYLIDYGYSADLPWSDPDYIILGLNSILCF